MSELERCTFFWHDYETFGARPQRDRPAQFAGVRTDLELNEIGDPVERFCRPPLDDLPDPESCLLTGLTPQHCEAHGVPERAFAADVLAALGAPGTIGVGYNTLRFDDEVTRHLFWRNLIDPYAREWQNGCGRWDLLDVVRAAWALRPEGLAWPTRAPDDARPSFKLGDLAAANGVVHDAAHDALGDVRATVALARLVKRAQPRLWDFALGLRKRDAVLAQLGPALDRPFLHVSGRYRTERGCMAIVWPLSMHPTNRNELIVWDLAHDPAELLELDAETIRHRLYTKEAELVEQGTTRVPIKTVHLNKSPFVTPKLGALTDARAATFGIDRDAIARHTERARAFAIDLAARPWREVVRRRETVGTEDVDSDLYGGFVEPADRRRLDTLRRLDGAALAARRDVAFEDGRLEELVFRYRARHWPDSLDADEAQRWHAHRAGRLHDGAAGARTLAWYAERIDELAEQHVDAPDAQAKLALLEALQAWGERIAPSS